MCVIIARNPGVIIPEDKIDSACHVNSDGFGMSVVDRGQIVTTKLLKCDPRTITKMLEDAKDQKVFLHLRFKTHGLLNLDNVHPFESFKADGKEILFMHNGIIGDFTTGTDKESDTVRFNNVIVKPMIERFVKAGNDPAAIFDDELFTTVVQKYATGSKFVFFDEEENQIIFNKNNGKDFDGWWASNDYSFNRTHREPTNHYYYGKETSYGNNRTGGYWENNKWVPGDRWGDYESEAFDTKGTQSTAKAGTDGKAPVLNVVPKITGPQDKAPTIAPPRKRKTFIEIAKVEKLSQMTALSEEDIEMLVLNYPEQSKILIMDLLEALYTNGDKKVAA